MSAHFTAVDQLPRLFTQKTADSGFQQDMKGGRVQEERGQEIMTSVFKDLTKCTWFWFILYIVSIYLTPLLYH